MGNSTEGKKDFGSRKQTPVRKKSERIPGFIETQEEI